jgi:hypothetical protein
MEGIIEASFGYLLLSRRRAAAIVEPTEANDTEERGTQ